MKLLQVADGDYAIVDDEDFDRLSKFFWQKAKKSIGRQEPYDITPNLKSKMWISLPCEILRRYTAMFDHIDRDFRNNQKSNLRECSYSQNGANRVKELYCSSSFKGVNWDKQSKRWRAKITVNYKCIHLGCFKVEEEAAKAYNEAAKEHFGEFALLNKV